MKYIPKDNYRQLIDIYGKMAKGEGILCDNIVPQNIRSCVAQIHPVCGNRLFVA